MIRKATIQDLPALTSLALQLWPGQDKIALENKLSTILAQQAACFFLLYDADIPVGFAQCQLRYDYVEGTDTSPVGYLEGIYIKEPYRRRGFAQALLEACESWAAANGCQEFASDCELQNQDSLQFHLHTGFREANRIICFTKKLSK